MVKKIRMIRLEPSQDWVSLTRREILGSEEPRSRWFIAHWRPVLTGLTLSLAFVGGLLGMIRFSQEDLSRTGEPVSASPLVVLEDSLVGLKNQMTVLKEQIVKKEVQPLSSRSQQALEIQQMVQGIRELTQSIEQVDRDRVLAVLSADLEAVRQEVKVAFLERELAELRNQREQGLLNPEEVLILSAVEELYRSEEYEDAFWRLMELIN